MKFRKWRFRTTDQVHLYVRIQRHHITATSGYWRKLFDIDEGLSGVLAGDCLRLLISIFLYWTKHACFKLTEQCPLWEATSCSDSQQISRLSRNLVHFNSWPILPSTVTIRNCHFCLSFLTKICSFLTAFMTHAPSISTPSPYYPNNRSTPELWTSFTASYFLLLKYRHSFRPFPARLEQIKVCHVYGHQKLFNEVVVKKVKWSRYAP
jgi:hypothetical protein